MPTARELIEQADALMRRNRSNAVDDIPVLTEAVHAVEPKWVQRAPGLPIGAGPASVPVLTDDIDVVDDEGVGASRGNEAVEGEPSAWLEFEDDQPSVIGDAPDSIVIVPPVNLRLPVDPDLLVSAEHEEIELTLPREELSTGDIAANDAAARQAAAAATAATPTAGEPSTTTPVMLSMADDDERWVSVAEEIRMQVLQRIDLFTDTGLRDQLSLRLQPIADRASVDFVAAINLHVGDLLRTYVAEAIEREIERWRRDH